MDGFLALLLLLVFVFILPDYVLETSSYEWFQHAIFLAGLTTGAIVSLFRSFRHAGELLLWEGVPDLSHRASERARQRAASKVPVSWRRSRRDARHRTPAAKVGRVIAWLVVPAVFSLLASSVPLAHHFEFLIQQLAILKAVMVIGFTSWMLIRPLVSRQRGVPVVSGRLAVSLFWQVSPFLVSQWLLQAYCFALMPGGFDGWEALGTLVVLLGVTLVDFGVMLTLAAALAPARRRALTAILCTAVLTAPMSIAMTTSASGLGIDEERFYLAALATMTAWAAFFMIAMEPAFQRLQDLELRDIPIGRLSTEMEPNPLLPIVPDVPPPPLENGQLTGKEPTEWKSTG